MQISQIGRVYEKYPYPAADETALSLRRWNLAPIEWINALWKPEEKKPAPKRILVAGCGTGREAFMLRRRFRKTRIVAVDFSPRSDYPQLLMPRSRAEVRELLDHLSPGFFHR